MIDFDIRDNNTYFIFNFKKEKVQALKRSRHSL